MRNYVVMCVVALLLIPAISPAATSITTRAGVGRSLTWSEMDTNFSNLRAATDGYAASLGSSIAAIQSAQTAGAIGYQTVTAMNADLAHAAGTLATVTNDPTASNNTYWIKLGASGTGSWQKSAISPFLPYYSSRQFTTLAQAITAIGSSVPSVLRVSTTLTVANGDTVPANISIIVENGGLLQGSGTETVTFNGPFTAGNHQAFANCGAVTGAGIKEARPEWFGNNTTPGTTDMTAAIRAACAAAPSGTVIFSNTYKVNTTGSPIGISIYQHLRGISRATAIINNSSTSDYTFQYVSPIGTAGTYGGDIEAGLTIENLTISAKYGIKLNSRGAYASVFQPQQTLKNIVIRNNSFFGTYASAGDPNINTATYPAVNADGSDNELMAYGCAIDAAKIFDSAIQNNLIQNNGIGIYLDGSDINNIDTNRFMINARHVHIYGHHTYGYQNKIQNNDMLSNNRRGGIYDASSFTSIKDNYFETYSVAAEQITQRGGSNTLIWGNRFDNSTFSTPSMSLAPAFGAVVSNNRVNPNGTASPVEVLSTNYSIVSGVANNFLVKFNGNSGSFTATKQPWCEYDFNNPRLFDAYNPKPLAGTPAAVFPFKTSPTSGRQVLTTSAGDFYVTMETKPTDSTITLKAAGTYINGAGYAIVTWGGTVAWSGYFGFTNTTGIQTPSVSVPRPAGVAPDSGLIIELVNTQVEYQALEII